MMVAVSGTDWPPVVNVTVALALADTAALMMTI